MLDTRGKISHAVKLVHTFNVLLYKYLWDFTKYAFNDDGPGRQAMNLPSFQVTVGRSLKRRSADDMHESAAGAGQCLSVC